MTKTKSQKASITLTGTLPVPEPHLRQEEHGLLQPGTVIGHYEIVNFLGKGGMGRVYRARDNGLKREVALKHISTAAGHSVTHAQERLRREALAMAQVEHPAVIRLYETVICDGELFVAMELARGGTLAQWMAERQPTWRAVLQVFLEAGQGLAAAHKVGLVHRDIKPSNILMDADGHPRICDFGLARMFADAPGGTSDCAKTAYPGDLDARITASGAIAGSFPYMAPEQLMGGAIDSRADQFAFCVSLWEALCGKRPFRVSEAAGKPEALVHAIAAGPVDSAHRGRRIPRRALAQVRRGLAADRDRRWASMEELLDALRRASSPRRKHWSAYAIGIAIAGISLALFAIARSKKAAPSSETAGDRPFAVRTLVQSSFQRQLVAMARDGEHFAICDRGSLQLASSDGIQQASIALPRGFTASAVAIAAHGEVVVVGGHLNGRWELWRFRSGDGAGQIVAVLPESMFDGLIEQERPPSIAIVEPDVMVAIGSHIVRIDAAGAVKVVVDDTGRIDRRFGSLRGVPGTRRVSVLDEIGGLTRVRVLELDGSTAQVVETADYIRGYDWLDATRLAVAVVRNEGFASLLELETASGRTRTVRLLGTVDHRVFDLYASPKRFAGTSIDIQRSLVAGSVQQGGWTPLDTAGWLLAPTGWLDAGTVVGAGRMGARRAVVVFGLAGAPRVVQQDAPGILVFYDENHLLMQDYADGKCILRDYRDGHAGGQRDLGCAADPILICADQLHEPCVIARWEGDDRVYRTFDARTLTTGAIRFVEPEPDRSQLAVRPAISPDGHRLAIPRPAGRMLFADLRDRRVTMVESMHGEGWQIARWIPDTTAVLATTIGSRPIKNRLDRVDIDGTVATLYEPPSGYVIEPTVSKDGSRIVITTATAMMSEIVIDLEPVSPVL